MARVFLPAQLADLTGGETEVDADGTTLREVLDALEARFPGIIERLVVDGKIRPGLAAAIDNEIQSGGLRHAVGPQSEVRFVPAISGGVL